ncbi:putative transmembrane protein [Rhodopirellula islandica]|uniref:Transmembrane protein n=1 Tax=Rhodopirellula islandica TaxID=595434 RepID=A0A0J1BIN1_RHOIS|nr:hypothetical protein [Rhodopirellula islandica]KLU06328.1 putative transmembrane protein [Rhodopirellula islandica]
MFPLRRSTKDPSVDWPALLSLLEDDDRRAAVARIAPSEGRESYLTALRRIENAQSLATLAAGRRLHTASKLVDRPTIAVSGMLNSGKTSLVSSFLSSAGQRRTLRGTSNRQGTHRFVLWLPQSWRSDVELWSLLITRIGDSLGNAPEELALDPEQAAEQYNNRDGDASLLSVPLLATDPGLDEVGVGLLDCPDIVSDEEFGLGSPEQRRELLGRAATLCSAFLIVTGAESSRDTTLADLLRIASDLMPGVPRMLAVNKVRPRQTPDQVHETFDPLVKRYGVATLYAAYDFDVPSSRPFIPIVGEQHTQRDAMVPAESDLQREHEPEPLPVFFAVSEDPDNNPPAVIEEDRLLQTLPSKLDRGVLFSQLHQALRINLEDAIWNQGVESIRRDADESFEKTRQCQQVLLDSALEYFAHRKIGGEVIELRLHQSERIIRQLSESFAATAPWYARWGVRLNSTLRRVVGGAGDFIRNLTPTAVSRRAADDIKGRFRSGEYGGLIEPTGLINEIERHGGTTVLTHLASESGGRSASEAEVSVFREPVERAVLRFEQDDFTTLDPRRLDTAVRQMWAEVPVHRKIATGLTPLAALFATFGAVLMIPVDLGANAILAASIPEMLAAAGLTIMSTMWAANRGTQDVSQQAARQQLADFLAVLCDELGVARPDPPMDVRVGNTNVTLPPSRITSGEPPEKMVSLFRVRDEFVSELKRLLPRPTGAKTRAGDSSNESGAKR